MMRLSTILGLAVSLIWSIPSLADPTAQIPLRISPQRETTLTTWVPEKVQGVVLLSTGHGSSPEKYDALASAWKTAGFAVVAPLHVDSLRYPGREKFTMQASFGERIADLKAASAYAAATWPTLPVIAAGHSFGTLSALCLGGGLSYIGDFRDPTIKAVIGFSSPGRLPGLIQPHAYASDALPILLITGDRDMVPGVVTDWQDHLMPVQTSPAGDKYAISYAGAGHELVGTPADPNFAAAVTASTRFLQAYALGDAPAKAWLRGGDSPGTWIRR
ncbi:alpha/beta hydrolase family protein [Sphingomonas sp. 37zxx]|uniref:alpha/beta hydrolase family protein n=1 Tax=Sphingomonas sp. 37zxx TaxID=1550073 RepID=UPI00053BDBB2|nr:alpha/beta hydrolase [Sphingomonas sp. 37zxx]